MQGVKHIGLVVFRQRHIKQGCFAHKIVNTIAEEIHFEFSKYTVIVFREIQCAQVGPLDLRRGIELRQIGIVQIEIAVQRGLHIGIIDDHFSGELFFQQTSIQHHIAIEIIIEFNALHRAVHFDGTGGFETQPFDVPTEGDLTDVFHFEKFSEVEPISFYKALVGRGSLAGKLHRDICRNISKRRLKGAFRVKVIDIPLKISVEADKLQTREIRLCDLLRLRRELHHVFISGAQFAVLKIDVRAVNVWQSAHTQVARHIRILTVLRFQVGGLKIFHRALGAAAELNGLVDVFQLGCKKSYVF